jgi:hypothetical protein
VIARRRWHVNPNLADGLAAEKAFFIDQVGKADLYATEELVAEITRDWDEKMGAREHGRGYSYKHAQLKYPRIAHKITAMRAMIWGKVTHGHDET